MPSCWGAGIWGAERDSSCVKPGANLTPTLSPRRGRGSRFDPVAPGPEASSRLGYGERLSGIMSGRSASLNFRIRSRLGRYVSR